MLYSNLARVALVWMDDWKEFFFKFNPGLFAFHTFISRLLKTYVYNIYLEEGIQIPHC